MASEFHIPRHMRSPGDDGYRTPTIEDAERTLSTFGVGDSLGIGAREVHTSALESVLQRAPSRATVKTIGRSYSHRLENDNLDNADLARRDTESSASTLSWKKRIRHVTWAYFTITMATGGLANVLYEGR